MSAPGTQCVRLMAPWGMVDVLPISNDAVGWATIGARKLLFGTGFDGLGWACAQYAENGGPPVDSIAVSPSDFMALAETPPSFPTRLSGLDAWLPTADSQFFGLDRTADVKRTLVYPGRWLRIRIWLARHVLRVAVDG